MRLVTFAPVIIPSQICPGRGVDKNGDFALSWVTNTKQEKSKVRECAKTAEKWLFQKLDQQANIPPSKNPVRGRTGVNNDHFILSPIIHGTGKICRAEGAS